MSNLELGFDLDALKNQGKRKRLVFFEYIKDGTSVYHLVPAYASTSRELSHLYRSHRMTGPTGNFMSVSCTYYSPERYCPLCESRKQTMEAIDRAKREGNEDEATRLSEQEKGLRVWNNVYYNAVNAANEVVILQLSSTVANDLNMLVAEAVEKRKFDPSSPTTGVWFKFRKTGKGQGSTKVEFSRITAISESGEEIEKLDRSSIHADVLNGLDEKVADIHSPSSMFIKEYTAAQLVNVMRGVPAEGESTAKPTIAQVTSPIKAVADVKAPAVEMDVPDFVAKVAAAPTAIPAAQAPISTPKTTNYAAEIARLKAFQEKAKSKQG